MTYLRANSNIDHKNPISSLKAYIKKNRNKNLLNFLCESKELEQSGLKGGSNGLMILPDQISQSKGNQSLIFIRRTDAEAEAPILWPLDAKN